MYFPVGFWHFGNYGRPRKSQNITPCWELLIFLCTKCHTFSRPKPTKIDHFRPIFDHFSSFSDPPSLRKTSQGRSLQKSISSSEIAEFPPFWAFSLLKQLKTLQSPPILHLYLMPHSLLLSLSSSKYPTNVGPPRIHHFYVAGGCGLEILT